jgi:hypothetical protein
MPRVGFELMIPAFERAKTIHALDRATTVIDAIIPNAHKYQIPWNPIDTFRIDECDDVIPNNTASYQPGHFADVSIGFTSGMLETIRSSNTECKKIWHWVLKLIHN